jgi:hypothetical protein
VILIEISKKCGLLARLLTEKPHAQRVSGNAKAPCLATHKHRVAECEHPAPQIPVDAIWEVSAKTARLLEGATTKQDRQRFAKNIPPFAYGNRNSLASAYKGACPPESEARQDRVTAGVNNAAGAERKCHRCTARGNQLGQLPLKAQRVKNVVCTQKFDELPLRLSDCQIPTLVDGNGCII